jgi:hypothetical protein
MILEISTIYLFLPKNCRKQNLPTASRKMLPNRTKILLPQLLREKHCCQNCREKIAAEAHQNIANALITVAEAAENLGRKTSSNTDFGKYWLRLFNRKLSRQRSQLRCAN